LIWAAAIARTSPASVAGAFLLLFFYALSYSVWGLVTLALWERRAESRQVFIRCFFFALVVASALIYLPLNPVAFLLAYLGRQELSPLTLMGRTWSATAVHFAFHLVLGGAGLAAYAWALKKQVAV
jgi:hypothetical protein